MADQSALVSKAFQTFLTEAPNHAQAWGKMVQELGAASALDAKTRALAYLSSSQLCASRVASLFTSKPPKNWAHHVMKW